MKQFYAVLIILSTIAVAVWFDEIVVFLLSGFIPGINVVLAPSTMVAVMIASTLLLLALRSRRDVYNYCLALYDEFLGFSKKGPEPSEKKPELPRRRYQEL